jgi:hypothetical protein
MKKVPSAFVSYSWDSKEHQDWVLGLVNLLRKSGVDATADVFETQKGTVNLYNMMIDKIRSSDFTVIVLTPEYAAKADEFQGGVGFETTLLVPFIQENMQKIIPIMKWCTGGKDNAIPFYLKGVHYIDFSNEVEFDERFQALLHRIHKVDLIEKSPLGHKPNLIPKKIGISKKPIFNDFNELIPDFREITDIDKNRFMRDSFIQIRDGLLNLLEQAKKKNANFEYDFENVTSRKAICKIYINGRHQYGFKIWLGNGFYSKTDTIDLAYGRHISDSDNSMNEIITCNVTKDKSLILEMTMNMYGTAFAFKTAALELAFDYKGISFKGSINSLVLNIFPG